jgi:hypothetical protein
MEMTLWCDESDSDGRFYSNFYGGALVHQSNYTEVVDRLERRKAEQNLYQEVKWVKVTANYLTKYMALMDEFFALVKEDKIKVRIMFTKNANVPVGLTEDHVDNRYFILYYQFIKYGFGFMRYSGDPINLRIFVDNMPDTKEKVSRFKRHVFDLNNNPEFAASGIKIHEDHISEADSKKYLVLQCTDIVLGAINFRLNNKHLEKPEGQNRRGKKTLAKLKLYNHINRLIRNIYPNFNIGITTGRISFSDYWTHQYRHWEFKPRNHEVDKSKHK